jgi:hypothetical protein
MRAADRCVSYAVAYEERCMGSLHHYLAIINQNARANPNVTVQRLHTSIGN